jgi:hypothetical protein
MAVVGDVDERPLGEANGSGAGLNSKPGPAAQKAASLGGTTQVVS